MFRRSGPDVAGLGPGGTCADQIVAKLHEVRDRWGITYFAVRERDTFADVIRAVSTGTRLRQHRPTRVGT